MKHKRITRICRQTLHSVISEYVFTGLAKLTAVKPLNNKKPEKIIKTIYMVNVISQSVLTYTNPNDNGDDLSTIGMLTIIIGNLLNLEYKLVGPT